MSTFGQMDASIASTTTRTIGPGRKNTRLITDLVIVGIHTAEFDAEKDVDRIKDRAAKNHLTFAIAVDNKGANWKAWGNRYWPCIYLVDKAGKIRYRWEGELGDDGYKKVTAQIDKLLAERSPTGMSLLWMTSPRFPEHEITPPALYFNRRRLLRGGFRTGGADRDGRAVSQVKSSHGDRCRTDRSCPAECAELDRGRPCCTGLARQRADDVRGQYPHL